MWRAYWLLLTLLTAALLTAAPPVRLLTTRDASLLAAADAARLGKEAETALYLWLPNIPAADVGTIQVVLSGHCNSLSTETDLSPLAIVPGSDGQLLRADLSNYGWQRKTLDLFFDSDPYFYSTAEEIVLWPGGYWPRYQQHYEAGRYSVGKAVRTTAPWLDPAAMKTLVETCQAKAPIVNALYFFQSTAACSDGRKPNYYDMLGIKDEKTFQVLVGVDLKRDVRFARELLETVSISGVSEEPRAIAGTEKIGGRYWRTFDIKRGTQSDKKDPHRIYGTDSDGNPRLEFDASEQYAHLPNGLWATLLVDNKGKLQDSVPDTIAGNKLATGKNFRIENPVSCIGCHKNGGLQDIDGWVRASFTPPPFILQAATPKDAVRLRQQYLRKLEPFLIADRCKYADALLQITGLTPQKYAAAYAGLFNYIVDAQVGLEWVERDLGVPRAKFLAALEWKLRTTNTLDPVLNTFLLPPERFKPITITAWWRTYPIAQQILQEFPK